jgi:hypothetical protein
MNLTQIDVAELFCGTVAELESLHADFGDSARRELRVRASARIGQPWGWQRPEACEARCVKFHAAGPWREAFILS